MDFCLLNRGNCLECQIKLTDINTPISFYGNGYKSVCKKCNTIPVCAGILPYFKKNVILNFETNNIIPILIDYNYENIYNEIPYILTNTNGNGDNGDQGVFIEDYIYLIINGFILKKNKKRMSKEEFLVIKDKIKQQTHDKHLYNLYMSFVKIHEDYTIVETEKYVRTIDNITGVIDIVCENCLIDIKVVKNVNIQKCFIQLILYHCILNNPNINKLGIYDYYKGKIYWLETININIIKLIEFIKSLNLQNGKIIKS
jgi:hypothetical protein